MFLDRNGHVYATEEAARWGGSTHRVCEFCGQWATPKYRVVCERCRAAEKREKWNAMPRRAWDGKTPISEYGGEAFIYDEDQLADFMEEWQGDLPPMFVLCEQEPWPLIDPADICEQIEEVGDDEAQLPVGVEELIEKANEILDKSKTGVWREKRPFVAIDLERHLALLASCQPGGGGA